VNWSPRWNQSRAGIFATPAIMRYVAGWPRPDDLGLVAEAASMADEARARGIQRISLSVERKNYARALYLSEGYRVVDSSDPNSDTMVRDLTPGPES
jgi:hypothetical protein